MKRLLLAVALLGVTLTLDARVPIAIAAGSSAASIGSSDHTRCSGGFYDDTANPGYMKEEFYCYFDLSVTADSGSFALGATAQRLKAAAGTTLESPYNNKVATCYQVYSSTALGSSCLGGFEYSANDATTCTLAQVDVGPGTFGGLVIPAGAAHVRGTGKCHPYTGGAYGTFSGAYSISGCSNALFTSYDGCAGYWFVAGGGESFIDSAKWSLIDYFPGGSAYAPAPVNWCDGLTFTVPNPAGSIALGENVVVSLASTGGAFTAAASGTTIGYRWTPADAFADVTPGLTSSWTTGSTGTVTLPYLKQYPSYFASLEFKCSNTAGSRFVTTAGNTANPQTLRPCNTLQVDWPSFPINTGEAALTRISMPAGGLTSQTVTAIDALIYGGSDALLTPTSTAPVTVFTASLTGSSVSLPMHRGDQWTFVLVWSTSSDLHGQNIGIRCHDSSGTKDFRAPGQAVTIATTDASADYGNRLVVCIGDSNLSFDPSSWAPWMIHAAGCMMQYAFEPTSADVDKLRVSAGTLTVKAPFSYIVQTVPLIESTFANAPGVLDAHKGDSFRVFAGMAINSGRMHLTITPQDANFSALGDSRLATLRGILGYMVWLYGIYVFFQITRRLVYK